MLRRLFVLFLLGACSLPVLSQGRTRAGAWTGSISTPGIELRVIVNLQQKEDKSWAGTIDIPMQNAKALPLANIAVESSSVSFAIGGVPGTPTFSGKLSEDGSTIAGDFTQGPGKFSFKLTREQAGQVMKPNRPQEPQKPYPYE